MYTVSPTANDFDFEALLEESFATASFERGDTVSGTVLSANHKGLIVGVGSMRDGYVERADLEKMGAEPTDFQIGQEVDVTIIRMEDEDGNLVLSISQARQSEDWKKAEELLTTQDTWPGFVTDANRGGLIFCLVMCVVSFRQATCLIFRAASVKTSGVRICRGLSVSPST